MNRFDNAIAIQKGACNPSGIVSSLLGAIREAREENPDTDSIRNDPAVRLICHQLAFLLNVREIEDSFTLYHALMETCEKRETKDT